MAKKTNITQEDLELFLKAVKGIKPIQYTERVPHFPKDNSVKAAGKNYDDDEPIVLSEKNAIPAVDSEESIVFKHPSIANKILRKLNKGQYNVEAILDLHGMSVEKAGEAVIKFLHQCRRNQLRVVSIIHGKGHPDKPPVLKNKLNVWLREIDLVLAFCSAPHGNRGAIYIYLKTKGTAS
jgi:DNA-nicking Smr family endonuclease